MRLREATETARKHVRVSILFSTSVDESGQVRDEQVVVGNHQQVDMMFPIAVIRSLERKDFVV